MVQGGRGGELGNTLGKVTEGVALLRHYLSHEGHKSMEIEIPKQLPWHRRWAELQQTENSPFSKDPRNLPEASSPVGKVAQTKSNGDGIKRAIRKGKLKGIGFGQFVKAPPLGLLEQGTGEIEADNLSFWQGFLKHLCHIAGATGQIEDLGGVLSGHSANEMFSPNYIHPQAEDSIQTIVMGRKFVKERANPVRLHSRKIN